VSAVPSAAAPVSGAPKKQNWFAPVSDTDEGSEEGAAPAAETAADDTVTEGERTAESDTAEGAAVDAATTAEPAEAVPAEDEVTESDPVETLDSLATDSPEPQQQDPDEAGDEPEAATPAEEAPPAAEARSEDDSAEEAGKEAEQEAATEPQSEATPVPEPEAEPAPEAEPPAEPEPAAAADPAPAPQPPAAPRPEPTTAPPSATTAYARQPGHGREHHPRRLADPEQVLSAYPWRFSPDTLRELIDDPEELLIVRDRLTDKLEYAERDAVRARLLSLRAVVSRVLGDLDLALADGREALGHAEATGELRRTSIVQARLAHVLQWAGDFAEADRLYELANSPELPDRLRAEMFELAGRSAFEQGRHLEAMNRFEQALDMRRGEDPELVSRIEAALDAVQGKAAADGWGPYPRSREEILREPAAPRPLRDERTGLWGYVGAVAPQFAEAQPFREGRAWVRRPEGYGWELVDDAGQPVGGASGYLMVQPFSDGLAWVSRDEAGGWFGVDRDGRVVVPGGFDEVRPFRRGLAAVRRGGWGAVDRHGRAVVPPKYRGFATTLAGGRRMDGFTDEGLAVVDAGDRLGVVDRSGQLLVAPVHARLVIHPVAFLIGDRNGRWGALDREGEPLVDVVHRSEGDVADAIDGLLSDTRPVL
jgi:tetratricopeptide (TPR) repeat protein